MIWNIVSTISIPDFWDHIFIDDRDDVDKNNCVLQQQQ